MPTYEISRGSIIRLMMLMTHYRSPLDFTKKRMDEAEATLQRWILACIPNQSLPPSELLECLCQDLNTPKAIALLHRYRKEDGKKLFASLRFLGFFDCEPSCLPDEWKTLPKDQEDATGQRQQTKVV